MRCPLDRCKGLAALAVLLVCAPARAEVSAEVDAFGNYVRTVVVTAGSARRTKIWSPFRSRSTRLMLNSTGDATGDGWPAILESPVDGKPWVVWSHFDGADFDLAWSRFGEGNWEPVKSLLALDSSDPDLDPVLAFDDGGRPYVTWWRNSPAQGRIYVSLFLTTRWMIPLQVSDPGEDARTPTLVVLPDRRMQVSYSTPGGTVTKLVVLNAGATITDDINPFGSFSVTTVNRH
ncbi:MAG TPA: hypothetical protein VFV75_08000 [Candidatus Polarisedimenticolaceae bacterium]|nr:hypothetical protein [Candidatus Polarisedimenticolaceae bacterium]